MDKKRILLEPLEESPVEAACGIRAALNYLSGEAERFRLYELAGLIREAAERAASHNQHLH